MGPYFLTFPVCSVITSTVVQRKAANYTSHNTLNYIVILAAFTAHGAVSL